MARRDIDKWSFGYWFLKNFWAWVNQRLYYRKVRVYDREKVPRNTPVIVVSNHQNALMDAMAYVTLAPVQKIFLTRADVFNKPWIERILYFMKMLPIYRIRDGRDSLKKNDEIFDLATKVVHNGKCPLYLFPEGNHGDKRRLRPLVKGVFRIAFKAQEKYLDQPGVKIVPAGLEYQDYQKFGKELHIQFGDPIDVKDYWKEFEENQANAFNLLKDRLMTEMRKNMIDIQTEEYYNTYESLRQLTRSSVIKKLELNDKSLHDKFKADKYLIAQLDKQLESNEELIKDIDTKTTEYNRIIKKLNVRSWLTKEKGYSIAGSFLYILASLILSPFVLFGLINNAPNFFVPFAIAKKIKDTQFRSTAAWGTGLVMQILYYPILIVLAYLFLPELWMKLVYIPLIPLSIKPAYAIWKLFRKNLAKIRYTFLMKKDKNLQKAHKLHLEIISDIETKVL